MPSNAPIATDIHSGKGSWWLDCSVGAHPACNIDTGTRSFRIIAVGVVCIAKRSGLMCYVKVGFADATYVRLIAVVGFQGII